MDEATRVKILIVCYYFINFSKFDDEKSIIQQTIQDVSDDTESNPTRQQVKRVVLSFWTIGSILDQRKANSGRKKKRFSMMN